MQFVKKIIIPIKKVLLKNIWIVSIAIALVVRLVNITKSSIWHDEGYTMWLIRNNLVDIIFRTGLDVHPPAYYLVAKFWTLLFGDSVFSIRFLSILFSIATIFVIYKIIELLVNKKAAFWASIFLAASPFLLRLSQEARMYSMVGFLIAIAIYYFIKYIKTYEIKNLVLYTLFMLIAVYTQYYSIFVIICLWIIQAIISIMNRRNYKNNKSTHSRCVGIFDVRWWMSNVFLLLLYLPWIFVAYNQVTRVSSGYWIRPEWINIETIPNTLLKFITYNHISDLTNSVYGIIVICFLMALFIYFVTLLSKDLKKRMIYVFLLIFCFFPIMIVFIYSKLRTPIYQDRYFIFSLFSLFSLFGCAIVLIKNKLIRYFTASLLMLVMFIGCVVQNQNQNHKMFQISHLVKANANDDMVISGSLYTFLDSSYYLGYGNIKLLSDGVGPYGESSLFYDQADRYIISKSELNDFVDRFWVIGHSGESYSFDNTWKLRTEAKIVEGNIELNLFEKEE